jgi:hypothetical protein
MATNDAIIRFEGGVADSHKIPAYEGSVSLRGTTRSIVMVGSCLVEGEIRKRAPFSSNIRFYISPPRPGSFENLISFVVENPETAAVTAVLGTVGVNVLSNMIWDGIKYCFNRVVGKEAPPETDAMKAINDQKGGDIEALIDAIEPSAREAHTAIGFGADRIILIQGDNNIVTLNEATKRYVLTTVRAETDDVKQVSVGMFNVNTRYGRVFDYEFGKTISIRSS